MQVCFILKVSRKFHLIIFSLVLILNVSFVWAGEWPVQMDAYRGSTPTIDGVITPGEYDDGCVFLV